MIHCTLITSNFNYTFTLKLRLAGLALANGLSRLGVSVIVLEKSSQFLDRGSALSLAPNGVKALNEISSDLRSHLENVGIKLKISSSIKVNSTDEYTINEVPEFKPDKSETNDTIKDNLSIMLPWWECRNALLNVLPNNVKILLNTTVENIIHSDTNNIIIKSNTNQLFKTKLLIGAGGVFSNIRKHLNLSEPIFTHTRLSRATIHANNEEYNKLKKYCHDENTVALFISNKLKSTFSVFFMPNNKICWVTSDAILDDTRDVTERFSHFPNNIINELFKLTPHDTIRHEKLHVIELPKSSKSDIVDTIGSDMAAKLYISDKVKKMNDVNISPPSATTDTITTSSTSTGGITNDSNDSIDTDECGYGGHGRICIIGTLHYIYYIYFVLDI